MSGRNKVTGTVAIAASASLALAACGGGSRRAAVRRRRQADQRQGRHRPAQRPVGRLQGPVRPQLQGRDRDGDRGLPGQVRRRGGRQDHRGHPGRPPEQARHRQHQGAGDVRPAERRHHPRRPHVLGRPGRRAQAKAKKKLYINIGAATTALTGESCNKYTFHWAYDTYMLAHGTARDRQERRQDVVHRLPRLRLRPGHEQVVHRRPSRARAAGQASRSRRRSPTTTSRRSSPRPPRATLTSSASWPPVAT